MPDHANTERYVVLQKAIGETPLQCLERFRATRPDLADVPLAYAGRLDPMASGLLLILIGDECKRQQEYHGLDKTYQFALLLGAQTDTGDVLGLITKNDQSPQLPTENDLQTVTRTLTGDCTMPYPTFSAKTVHGKPLHWWAVHERLTEIVIPTYTSTIHTLQAVQIQQQSAIDIYTTITDKIETLPTVTDASKAAGNDFRRPVIRKQWSRWINSHTNPTQTYYPIIHFEVMCSAGTYVRTLCEQIAKKLGTVGLAYAIHRTAIGDITPTDSTQLDRR